MNVDDRDAPARTLGFARDQAGEPAGNPWMASYRSLVGMRPGEPKSSLRTDNLRFGGEEIPLEEPIQRHRTLAVKVDVVARLCNSAQTA